MYDDREFLDANLYSKSELPAELAPLPDILAVKGIDELTVDETEQAARAIQLPQGYAFELSPWCEVLSCHTHIFFYLGWPRSHDFIHNYFLLYHRLFCK